MTKNLAHSKRRILFTPSSSAIEYVEHYDEDYLNVKFKHGGIYTYSNVSRSKFARMCNAESVGSYYVKNIKGQYNCIGPRNFNLENRLNNLFSQAEIAVPKKTKRQRR